MPTTRPTQILVNNEATITVAFMDYTGTNDPGNPVDPDSVDLVVLQEGVEIVSDTPTRLSEGEYSYVYTFTEAGDFIVRFTGHFTDDNATPSSTYDVVIEEDIIVVSAFTGQKKLGRTEEIVFSTGVTPLHVDPEDLQSAFPEAGLIEILGLIHKFSLEVDRILNNERPLPQLAYDYIREATLCSLAGVYDAFDAAGGAMTLGDLTIDSGRRYYGVLNRGNAANACERAFVLRQELIRSVRPSKAVVKGSRVTDRLPDRKIRHQMKGEL